MAMADILFLTDNPPRIICPHLEDTTANDWVAADVALETLSYTSCSGIVPSYDDIRNALFTLNVFVSEMMESDNGKCADCLKLIGESVQSNKNRIDYINWVEWRKCLPRPNAE